MYWHLFLLWLRPLLILFTPPILIVLLIKRPWLRTMALTAWALLAFVGCYPLFLIMIATSRPPAPGVQVGSLAAVPSPSYRTLISEAAARHAVDPSLVAALIEVESNWNPDAVSGAGAMGLMQLMPATAREMGVSDPFDPAQNVEGGTKYLAWLLDYYGGDVDKSIMAYHGGPGTVDAGARPIDREYLRRVTAVWPTYQVVDTAVGNCAWSPIYTTATITQGPHGQSYGHYAIDVAGGYGASVNSPIDGRATLGGDAYGNTVLTIENECYIVTLLHGDWTAVGDVQRGQPVGTEGNNGYTMDSFGRLCSGRVGCGYHSHISVYDKRIQSNVDPRDLGLTGW